MVFDISLSILGYFSFPEIRDLRLPCTETITVPEIPVYEYGDLGTHEYNIRFAGEFLHMLSKPQSFPVKCGPYTHFNTRILPLHPRHTVTPLFGG